MWFIIVVAIPCGAGVERVESTRAERAHACKAVDAAMVLVPTVR